MVLHINELPLCEGKSGFKRGLRGRREAVEGTPSPERSSAKEAPTDGARGAAGRTQRTERSREELGVLSGHREKRSRQCLRAIARKGGRPPLVPAPAPRAQCPSDQHEAPDRCSVPAASGSVRRGSGRVQMQVLPEGAQNPLQRCEEAGDEAKVPALRGEDGYHHHQKRVQIPGSGALPAPQAAEHQEVHQVVQCLEREAQGLRRIG